jgi:MFS family permease
VRSARNAVVLAFVTNGVLAASLVTRLPDLRESLSLDNASLGLVLLAMALGAVLALPTAGALIHRWSAGAVVRGGSLCSAVGLLVGALGASPLGWVWLLTAGLFVYGVGTSIWDVAMNVEGAEVERRLGRSIMPRFHAAWSMGSIAGAAIGVPMAWLHVPLAIHLGGLGIVVAVACFVGTHAFLPAEEQKAVAVPGSAWLEPRTLAIGVMMLAFAVVEGSANDWLSLGLIDGYHQPHWVGVAGYALFVCAMTTGRLLGPIVLDRYGRAPVLWATAATAAIGILLVVLGGHWAVVVPGIVIWGFGASLGFPVGMSAAADDPVRSAARVSVVSTIGYGAFLAGPPLLGYLGDRVGTLDALLAVALLMIPAALTVFAARPARPTEAAR